MGTFTSTNIGSRNSQVGYVYHTIWLTRKLVNKMFDSYFGGNEWNQHVSIIYILFLKWLEKYHKMSLYHYVSYEESIVLSGTFWEEQ